MIFIVTKVVNGVIIMERKLKKKQRKKLNWESKVN